MLTTDTLKEYGADIDEGMARCFGNADFYLKLAATIPAEPSFDKLKSAIDANDLGTAFEAAHALKGVLANLSLTPILKPVAEITELLRAKEQIDYSPLLEKIFEQKALLENIIAK